MVYKYDEDHYDTFKLREGMLLQNSDVLKEHIIIPAGSLVAIQREDVGSWTHGTLIEHGNKVHNEGFYMICITKPSRMVTRIIIHVREALITADQHLREQLSKRNEK